MQNSGGLNFAEQITARIMIATQSGKKKEEFMEAADPEGKLSPEVRETVEAVFDAFVDAVTDNLDKFNTNDPIFSAASIISQHFQDPEHLKEAAEVIFKETGLDMANITPDKSDDPTQAQIDEITETITKGMDGLQNLPPESTVAPETQPTEIEEPDGSSSIDKGYEQGVDGTAYTTEVNALEAGGEPEVNFENGVSVGEVPIQNFFAQNVLPDPESVTLVNAMAPENAIAANDPVIPTVEAEQSVQTLG